MVDESLIRPSYLSLPNLAFIGCIFLLGLGVSWGLTSTLLKPISRLVDFITGIANDPAHTLPPLPRHWRKKARETKMNSAGCSKAFRSCWRK